MGLNAAPSLALAFGDIHAAALSHAPFPPRMVLTGAPVRLAASLAERVPQGCIHIATHEAVSDAASPGFQHTFTTESHLGASVSVLKLTPVLPCEVPEQTLTMAAIDPKILRYARRVLSGLIRSWLDSQTPDKSAVRLFRLCLCSSSPSFLQWPPHPSSRACSALSRLRSTLRSVLASLCMQRVSA